MYYYIRYGDFQQHVTQYHQETGKEVDFLDMVQYLCRKGMLSTQRPANPPFNPLTASMSNEGINQFVDQLVLTANTDASTTDLVQEADMFPGSTDVFIIRHPLYTSSILHRHNYFEINYVIHGQCNFRFENTSRILTPGDFCIIAAGSRHAIEVDEDATIFTIMLRKSTFGRVYMSLLNNQDVLSRFFYTSLINQSEYTNYIRFHCSPSPWIISLILNAMIECSRDDPYGNVCSVSMINQIFAYIMRNHEANIEMFSHQIDSEFAAILQHIQMHYQDLTLSQLASHFHYSVPHLCTLIKQSTGKTFSELVTELRLTDAANYLINSSMKVHEIAERVGYNSADHFSRTFRAKYNLSPQAYRRQFVEEDDVLIPFKNQDL